MPYAGLLSGGVDLDPAGRADEARDRGALADLLVPPDQQARGRQSLQANAATDAALASGAQVR